MTVAVDHVANVEKLIGASRRATGSLTATSYGGGVLIKATGDESLTHVEIRNLIGAGYSIRTIWPGKNTAYVSVAVP